MITKELNAPKALIALTLKKAGKLATTCSIGRYAGGITVK